VTQQPACGFWPLAFDEVSIKYHFNKFMKPEIEKNSTLSIIVFSAIMILSFGNTLAQNKKQMVRLAKIVIDSSRLEEYKAILKEEAEKSIAAEPGVLTLYAVSEKENPTHFTILEIYADSAAYKAHLQTSHFLRYKTGTKDMVKSLELVETVPLIPGMKIKDEDSALKGKRK
jgi:quinol monooxygenase YgiN